jgi:hypothetical protein
MILGRAPGALGDTNASTNRSAYQDTVAIPLNPDVRVVDPHTFPFQRVNERQGGAATKIDHMDTRIPVILNPVVDDLGESLRKDLVEIFRGEAAGGPRRDQSQLVVFAQSNVPMAPYPVQPKGLSGASFVKLGRLPVPHGQSRWMERTILHRRPVLCDAPFYPAPRGDA